MTDTKLVIFDCDGTLVDSQHQIVHAMESAFSSLMLPIPTRQQIRGIIGLSLQEAINTLAGEMEPDTQSELRDNFRRAYQSTHAYDADRVEPLYPGVRTALEHLQSEGFLLAVATGNSMRGLERILAAHELKEHFISLQTADFHPSKPHPSMVHIAMSDAGAQPAQTVVIGDTTYDMQMARAAGVGALGISWGYHDSDDLHKAGAHAVVDDMNSLQKQIEAIL